MTTLEVNTELVARCGLYCGACKSYLAKKCHGCIQNTTANWCKVRSCCTTRNLKTCAECAEFANPQACKKFNNFMAKMFGFLFKSDRAACIAQIRKQGIEGHARIMAESARHTIKR